MREIQVTINGKKRRLSVDPDERLITTLRRLGFKSVKRGCDEGICGACTIIMDGLAVNCCLIYAWQAHERELVTTEGIGSFEAPHPIQTAMVEEAGIQCGFCSPGIIMSVKALIDHHPHATMDDARIYLDGNYCRCTGYEKIENAVKCVLSEGGPEEIHHA